MMRTAIIGGLLLWLVSAALVANGAQSDASPEPDKSATEGGDASNKTPPTARPDTEQAATSTDPNRKTKRDGDIFLPSEEISEDFAVSFPVDI